MAAAGIILRTAGTLPDDAIEPAGAMPAFVKCRLPVAPGEPTRRHRRARRGRRFENLRAAIHCLRRVLALAGSKATRHGVPHGIWGAPQPARL